MPPGNALPKKKNKYGYWVDPTHPSYPHVPTSAAPRPAQVSPKRPHVDIDGTQFSVQRAKPAETSKQFDLRKLPPTAIGDGHCRSTGPESTRTSVCEPFAVMPCTDFSMIPNNQCFIPFTSTKNRIRSTKKSIEQASQSKDSKCQRGSTAPENTSTDVEHLFTFTASGGRKQSTKLIKSEHIELVG